MTVRAGYTHDDWHARMVDILRTLLDRAAVEYDSDDDVVDDFTGYIKDWANRRLEAIQKQSRSI